MKCTICGRRTLPGAKLCLPCRSALRRARDDTVSELMPLPGRLAFAIPGSSTVSKTLDLVRERRAKRRSSPSTTDKTQKTKLTAAYSRLRVAAIGLFVLAVGVVAYGFTEQLRGDSPRSAASESAPVPLLRPSISPAALVAEARSTMLATPVSVETGAETVTPIPRPVETKPRKSGSGVTRSSAKVEAPTTTPIIVVPP